MSILIKGMKMPSVCDDCTFLDESGDYPMCRVTQETRGYDFPVLERRMARCPLIHIPDHGDLIDKDALEKDFIDLSEDDWNKKTGTSWAKAYEEAADVVFNAPVVIPAERSEE